MLVDKNVVNSSALLVSDAAKRMSDIITGHIVFGNAGRWVGIRLSDGGYDGTVYDSRRDCVAHQLTESQCAYIQIPFDEFPPRHAQLMLQFHRQAYDNGFRVQGPDDRRELITPYRREDWLNHGFKI
jgi:hypothetical protein